MFVVDALGKMWKETTILSRIRSRRANRYIAKFGRMRGETRVSSGVKIEVTVLAAFT